MNLGGGALAQHTEALSTIPGRKKTEYANEWGWGWGFLPDSLTQSCGLIYLMPQKGGTGVKQHPTNFIYMFQYSLIIY